MVLRLGDDGVKHVLSTGRLPHNALVTGSVSKRPSPSDRFLVRFRAGHKLGAIVKECRHLAPP